MNGAGRPARQVACPGCGESAEYSPANPWRPFCSERCRLVDLGAWASEAYRIPVKSDPGAQGLPGEGDEESPGGPQ
ncbi:MAG: DNA gyrase inhibitor YacG [Betaproteobacteria bacterium]|nr:DNA gyrase inhibitor YacG [Betaproteobacteria bacterium]